MVFIALSVLYTTVVLGGHHCKPWPQAFNMERFENKVIGVTPEEHIRRTHAVWQQVQ